MYVTDGKQSKQLLLLESVSLSFIEVNKLVQSLTGRGLGSMSSIYGWNLQPICTTISWCIAAGCDRIVEHEKPSKILNPAMACSTRTISIWALDTVSHGSYTTWIVFLLNDDLAMSKVLTIFIRTLDIHEIEFGQCAMVIDVHGVDVFYTGFYTSTTVKLKILIGLFSNGLIATIIHHCYESEPWIQTVLLNAFSSCAPFIRFGVFWFVVTLVYLVVTSSNRATCDHLTFVYSRPLPYKNIRLSLMWGWEIEMHHAARV